MTPEAPHPTNEDLFAYRDGELPTERRSLIEAHVLGCSQCRARLDAMSAAEGALRARPDDVDDAYFAKMTDAVLERIGGKPKPAPAAEPKPARAAEEPARPAAPKAPPAAPPAEPSPAPGPPRLDRRRPEPPPEEAPRRSRVGSWLGIVGSLAAAAAVLVVVVMLAQRQNDWVRAPRPGVLGEPESRARARADRATGEATEQRRAEEESKSGTPAMKKEAAPSKDMAGRNAPATGTGTGAAASAERSPANETKPAAGQPPEAPVAQRMAAQAPSSSAPSPSVATQRAADALGEPSAKTTPAGGAGSGEAYGRVVRANGLPPVWSPNVSRESLLGAESSLRSVYMSGTAGPDSARIRLYLAEAERLRLASPSDSAAVDRILHHYWRALRLAGDDRALADLVRRRLAEFQAEVGERP